MARNKNMSRNKKIGIAAAAVTAAIGTTAAIVLVRRRKETTDDGLEPGIPGDQGQGTGSPGIPGLLAAQRTICNRPNALTMEQRALLKSNVVAPILESAIAKVLHAIAVATGNASPSLGPAQIETVIDAATDESIRAICRRSTVSDATRQAVRQLAQGAWLTRQGITGQ